MFRIKNVVIGGVVAVSLVVGTGIRAEEKTIELTLRESIDHALENNLQFHQTRLGLKSEDLSIIQAQSKFDPGVSLNVSRDQSETPTFTQYINASTIERKTTRLNMSLGQELATGGKWDVGFNNQLSESNIETEKNYSSTFGFGITQPLLNGFGKKVSRSGIFLARLTRETTEIDIENQAMELVFNVQTAYWDLVYAWQTLHVTEMTVAQADSLLVYNQRGLELGVRTESDVLEAKSQLLSRQQDVLNQRNLIRSAEDTLRRLLNMTDDDEWNAVILPVDEPVVIFPDYNVDMAVRTALSCRPDYLSAKKLMTQYEHNRDVAENSVKPNLDLSARYNLHGSGTTYSNDVRDMKDFEQYGWNVGLLLSYPLKNRSAKAELEKREVDIRRGGLQLRDLENQIETDIRSALRNVDILHESVEVAKMNVEVDELKLKNEEERFRNKLSTSYYVLQFQTDLANSRTLYNKALIDYTMAVNELGRAQGTILRDMNITVIGVE